MKSNIFPYDLSILLIMKFISFLSIEIWRSDKFFNINANINSSSGLSIFCKRKFLVLDFKSIKEKYNQKIIVAITVKDQNDTVRYLEYNELADIILFDSKGYEKSMSFDHQLIKNIKINKELMLAGNIQIEDNLQNYKEIADIIDISGGLETSGLKDISKINIFLKKIKLINNEA